MALDKETASKFLKRASSRTLVLLSDTQLNEDEWVAPLRNYSSIADIQLSSDSRVAFVDFVCEHAPLVVARCFAYHQRNPDVAPMPEGLYAVLPGCSVDNFLFLYVPRALSSADLNRLISGWTDLKVTVHRAIKDSKPSTRAVVELHGALGSFQKQETDGEPFFVKVDDVNGTSHWFQAMPHLPQLADASGICLMEGCKYCTLAKLRTRMLIEEREFYREVNDVPVPPAPIQVKRSDEKEEKK